MWLNPETIDKLKTLKKHQIPIVILWGASTMGRDRQLEVFRIFGLLDPKTYHDRPDLGEFSFQSKYRLLLFVEILNKFGKRFVYTFPNNRPEMDDIGWRVSPTLFLTVLRLFEKEPQDLEEAIRTAENEKDFLALSPLIEK